MPDARSLQTLSSLTAIVRGDKGQLGNRKAAMVLTGPVFLTDLPEPFRKELDFFPFPTMDPAIPSSEVVFSIGYMVPAKAVHRQEALSFLTYLGSDKAQALLAANASNGLYAPARATTNQGNLSATIQQGIQLIQNTKTVVVPYFISVDRKIQSAQDEVMRQLLADSTSSQPFDLDSLLAGLETARQAK